MVERCGHPNLCLIYGSMFSQLFDFLHKTLVSKFDFLNFDYSSNNLISSSSSISLGNKSKETGPDQWSMRETVLWNSRQSHREICRNCFSESLLQISNIRALSIWISAIKSFAIQLLSHKFKNIYCGSTSTVYLPKYSNKSL